MASNSAALALESTLTAAIACAQLAGPEFREILDRLLALKCEAIRIRVQTENTDAVREAVQAILVETAP